MKTLSLILLAGILMFSLAGCDNWFVPEERELTLYSWGQGELNPPEGTQKVAEGEIIDLEAQAEEGWEFKEWVGNVENPEEPQTSIIMDQDQKVLAKFADTEDEFDYLGYNEGTLFVYKFYCFYEHLEEPEIMGEIKVEVLEEKNDQIKVQVSNGREWVETIHREDNSYMIYNLYALTLLEEYPIEVGVEGYEVLLPPTIIDEPLQAGQKKQIKGEMAWEFRGQDREIVQYWDGMPTDQVQEARTLIIPYQGLIEQEIIFDTASQEDQEYILERSLIELDRIEGR